MAHHPAAPTFDPAGLWVPVVTPFDDDGAVDHATLAALAERLLRDGVDGLVALGTTGEHAALDAGERIAVADTCAAVCADHGRPLLVGCGTSATATTLAEVRAWSARPGVDGLLLVTPAYTRPSEAAVVEHLRAAAAVTSRPIVAYNIPYRTGRGLGADALVALSGVPGIVGLKQAVGGLDVGTLDVLRRRADGFAVLAGDDAFAAPIILAGGEGAIAAAAHLATDRWVALVRAARAGDAVTAGRLAAGLLPVVLAGVAEPSPAGWKAALHALGELSNPAVRRPLTEASDRATAAVLAALAA